jgi:hypothetical protein
MNISDFFSTLMCLCLGAPVAAILTLWQLPDVYVARAVGLSLLVLALIVVCTLMCDRRFVDEDVRLPLGTQLAFVLVGDYARLHPNANCTLYGECDKLKLLNVQTLTWLPPWEAASLHGHPPFPPRRAVVAIVCACARPAPTARCARPPLIGVKTVCRVVAGRSWWCRAPTFIVLHLVERSEAARPILQPFTRDTTRRLKPASLTSALVGVGLLCRRSL